MSNLKKRMQFTSFIRNAKSADTVKAAKTWKEHFAQIRLADLKFLDPEYIVIIQDRMNETERCCVASAPMATMVLCGSVLEGILLNCAKKYPSKFSPDLFSECDMNIDLRKKWNTVQLIDAAYNVGLLNEDGRKLSKELMGHRNHIHVEKQADNDFTPTQTLSEICLLRLCEAITCMKNSDFNQNLTNENQTFNLEIQNNQTNPA